MDLRVLHALPQRQELRPGDELALHDRERFPGWWETQIYTEKEGRGSFSSV